LPYHNVGEIEMYYEMQGNSNEYLVLVHGYTGDISDWYHQINYFKNKYSVLAMDLRGHGLSESPRNRSMYTRIAMGEDIISLLKYLNINRFHIAGHSMGGGITQYIGLRIPEKIQSITLASSSLGIQAEEDAKILSWIENRLHIAEIHGMEAVANQDPIEPNTSMVPVERLQEELIRLSKMSVDSFIGISENFKIEDGIDKEIENIKSPTLILCGELDSETMLKNSINLSQLITNATLSVIPEAQHSPQWEFPGLFNEILDSFLADHR